MADETKKNRRTRKKSEIIAPPLEEKSNKVSQTSEDKEVISTSKGKEGISLANQDPKVIEAPTLNTEGSDANNYQINPVKAQIILRRQFLSVFIFGSAVIAFDLAGVLKLRPEFNMAFTLLLMGLFWLTGHKYLQNPLVRSVFADSMYYLGFLFTFVALAVSLMGLEALEDRDNFRLIVAQMGPALVTTVAGMAFRIYFTQFDAITTEPQEETLQALGQLSANLIPALEKLKEITAANQRVIEDHRKNVEGQIDAFAKSINRLNFKEAQKEIEALAISIESVTRSTEKIGQLEESVGKTIEKTTINLDNLSNEASKVSSKIEKAEEINDDIKTLNSRVEAAGTNINSAMDDVEKKMEDAGANISAAMDKVEKKIEDVDTNISSAVDKVEKNIQVAAREINLSSNVIAKDLQKVEEEAKTMNTRMQSAISDLVAFFNRQK